MQGYSGVKCNLKTNVMRKLKATLLILLAIVIITILVLPAIFNKETEVLNSENRQDAPGEFVELPNGVAHYEMLGPDTAQTVLLVHGFSVPSYIWDPTFKALTEQGFRVVRFDLFGRGYSDRPDAVYDGELFTQQIADLLSALKIDGPVDIVGLSMGGPIVSEFVAKNPGKVRKVVLISPFNEGANISVLNTPVIGEYLMNVYFMPALAKNQLEDFVKPEEHADWPAKFEPQMQYKGFKRAILSTLQNYMGEDKLPVFSKLDEQNKEVLLIWGEDDITTPYRGSERIREVVECEFLSVKEAGHLPHLEHPGLVNSRIISFLEE